MKPLHYGILFVGSFLVLVGVMSSSDEDDKNPEKTPESPEGDQVNLKEIRRLRRELRQQLTKKKKSLPTKGTS